MKQFRKYLDQFKNKKIAVIGDLILDKYIFGDVERISPEAPIPIINVKKETFAPGGAANVAANVATLSGKAYLFGIVGKDSARDTLLETTRSYAINTDGIFTDNNKTTIQKIRVIGQHQQLLRIDYEKTDYIDNEKNSLLFKKLRNLTDISAIVISDYAKGMISQNLVEQIKQYAKQNNILLIIDPKPLHKSFYKGAFLITPNRKEAQQMSGILIENREDFIKAGQKLIPEMKANIVLTAGELGMFVFEKGKEYIHIPTVAKDVFDVSGAGDTVVASLALALSVGTSLSEASVIANHAAGIKVGKVGTSPVLLAELLNSFQG